MRQNMKNNVNFSLLQVDAETNILQDGTLIDLCGATLLWRSAEGLQSSPVSFVANSFSSLLVMLKHCFLCFTFFFFRRNVI